MVRSFVLSSLDLECPQSMHCLAKPPKRRARGFYVGLFFFGVVRIDVPVLNDDKVCDHAEQQSSEKIFDLADSNNNPAHIVTINTIFNPFIGLKWLKVLAKIIYENFMFQGVGSGGKASIVKWMINRQILFHPLQKKLAHLQLTFRNSRKLLLLLQPFSKSDSAKLCCTVTVPKHLNMQTGGVWMTAWLEHAAFLVLVLAINQKFVTCVSLGNQGMSIDDFWRDIEASQLPVVEYLKARWRLRGLPAGAVQGTKESIFRAFVRLRKRLEKHCRRVGKTRVSAGEIWTRIKSFRGFGSGSRGLGKVDAGETKLGWFEGEWESMVAKMWEIGGWGERNKWNMGGRDLNHSRQKIQNLFLGCKDKRVVKGSVYYPSEGVYLQCYPRKTLSSSSAHFFLSTPLVFEVGGDISQTERVQNPNQLI
ncbi:hypothetical protein VP01_1198g1 [Puccinia sorghi]|uniref:Uncharacterized protein n=1 Tax=Puccinia sorghi TaxID=27349 RepID=A0A0L6VQN2_9BASI|nr:hypothetical protein VP01_1198g1 [Puccinia sorghi]